MNLNLQLACCGMQCGRQLQQSKFTYCTLAHLLYPAACMCLQVLHLCSVVAPNHDTTFSMSIVWTAIQLLCSSFFLNFSVVSSQYALHGENKACTLCA
jgi:hypothetical protein